MDSKLHFQGAMCANFTSPEASLYQAYVDYAAFAFAFTNTSCADWALGTFTATAPSPTCVARPRLAAFVS